MLLWRPAPGCTISASCPQQQQIWVVVPGDQVTTGSTVSSTKYLPRYQHHIGPSVPGSSLQPVSAASSAEYCKLFLRCVAGGGWRPAAALQHRTSPAPAQTESSPQLQSAVYSLPSLQSTATPLHTSCSQSTHRDQHTGAMVDISPDTASTVQEATDKVTICGIVRL